MPKKSFTMGADVAEALGVTGSIAGMFSGMRTELYASSIVEMTHAEMAEAFDAHMDLLFMTTEGRKAVAHVYDWPRDGGIRRLWSQKLLGQGRNRMAGFEWRASIRAIPTPLERHSDPNDPMSAVDIDELEKSPEEGGLSKRRYVFSWKAPIMEYNLPVTIAPRYAKALFIPTGDPTPGKQFVITTHAQQFNPGGNATTGAFSGIWVDWWATEAPKVFDDRIQRLIEADLAGIKFETAKYGKRNRIQSGSISVLGAEAAAHGKAIAEEYIKGRANGYRRLARATRKGELYDE